MGTPIIIADIEGNSLVRFIKLIWALYFKNTSCESYSVILVKLMTENQFARITSQLMFSL